jgi:glycerophosphoryl diester phosphodiesterase
MNDRRQRFGFVLRTISVLALLAFGPGCVPDFYPPTENTDLGFCVRDPACTQKLALGHRGTGSLGLWAPENTLAAYTLAWEMGADGMEIDARDTADGVPVMMHDDTVDRTTNGSGRVDEMTLEQIRALQVPSLNPAVPVQQVPTFREMLALLRGKTLVDVDIKTADVPQLVQIIAEEEMLDAAYLLVGSVAEGLEARSANAAVALMPKVSNVADVQSFLDALSPIDIFEIDVADALPEVIDFIHAQGIKVHMDALGPREFVDTGWYEELMNLGADILLTDRLDAVVPLVRGIPRGSSAPSKGIP